MISLFPERHERYTTTAAAVRTIVTPFDADVPAEVQLLMNGTRVKGTPAETDGKSFAAGPWMQKVFEHQYVVYKSKSCLLVHLSRHGNREHARPGVTNGGVTYLQPVTGHASSVRRTLLFVCIVITMAQTMRNFCDFIIHTEASTPQCHGMRFIW